MMLVSPSILSADFLNLERDVKRLTEAGADAIHIDIMDGIFVANTTWGPSTVSAIKKVSTIPLETHLMVDKPERILNEYLKAGSDVILIHPESTVYLRKLLLDIKQYGKKAGIALKLETPVNSIVHCLELVDVVLLLTCDEGFGGNPFQRLAIDKITQLAKWRKQWSLDFKIEVDGGINPDTGSECKKAGTDILVAGSYIFENDMKMAIDSLKEL